MIKVLILTFLLGTFFPATATPSVSLSGIVTNASQTAIAKACVYLKSSPNIRGWTDANGGFQLPGINAVKAGTIGTAAIVPLFKRDRLDFVVLHSGSDAVCELTALGGARIFYISQANLACGRHSIALPKTAPGVYVLHLSVGSNRYCAKIVAGARTGSFSAVSPAATFRTDAMTTAKIAAQPLDTIVVVARTYINALVGITAYDQKNISVALSASNPWKPIAALTHDKGMVKILAKGFDFEMGQPDPAIWGDTTSVAEQPVKTVQLSRDFWIDTAEVTQKDYFLLMKSTYPGFGGAYSEWSTLFGNGDSYPVYAVYWSDAALYCNALSKRDGLDTVFKYTDLEGTPGKMCFLTGVSIDTSKNGFRMPTEAQWEYACKAGGDFDFYWGKNFGSYPTSAQDTAEMGGYAVWTGNSHALGEVNPLFGTHQVCQKKPNAYGLYDMCGNVYEWCMDYFTYFKYGPALDPVVVTGTNLGAPELMTARGGSWGSPAGYLRAANRYWYQDAHAIGYWYKLMGIRTVKPVKE
jgi:formylglycine-generating enzyme required for sulfatase activity